MSFLPIRAFLPLSQTFSRRRNLNKLSHFLALIRFEHTIFALPFAYTSAILVQRWLNLKEFGFYLVDGSVAIPLFAPSPTQNEVLRNAIYSLPGGVGILPSWWDIVLISLVMVSGRTLAMLANRLIDREIDLRNPRTQSWHLPSGLVSVSDVRLWIVLTAAVFLLSAFFLNLWCFLLAPVVIAYLTLYPYAKRYTPLCHYVLGGAQALAPLGVFLAISGKLSFDILPFAVGVGLWVASFDVYYALKDYEFDVREGIHSLPASLGKERAKLVALSGHLLAGLLFLVSATIFRMGTPFFYGTVVFIAVLLYEYYLVKKDESYVGFTFFTLNGIISVLYLLVTVVDVAIA